jgi:hypothetical protein
MTPAGYFFSSLNSLTPSGLSDHRPIHLLLVGDDHVLPLHLLAVEQHLVVEARLGRDERLAELLHLAADQRAVGVALRPLVLRGHLLEPRRGARRVGEEVHLRQEREQLLAGRVLVGGRTLRVHRLAEVRVELRVGRRGLGGGVQLLDRLL